MASEAVLVESQDMPEGSVEVNGYVRTHTRARRRTHVRMVRVLLLIFISTCSKTKIYIYSCTTAVSGAGMTLMPASQRAKLQISMRCSSPTLRPAFRRQVLLVFYHIGNQVNRHCRCKTFSLTLLLYFCILFVCASCLCLEDHRDPGTKLTRSHSFLMYNFFDIMTLNTDQLWTCGQRNQPDAEMAALGCPSCGR